MNMQISSAFISVYSKDGLEPIVRELIRRDVTLYSTGGTFSYLQSLGVDCTSVEHVTGFPSILGGRVKTLHPKVFGGILARRGQADDLGEVAKYGIPLIDMVIVDLYPFVETVQSTDDEAVIIEKIDIGGVSLIRAAAKNFKDVWVVPERGLYAEALEVLQAGEGVVSLETRKRFAADAFGVCGHYDVMIASYFKSHGGSREMQLPQESDLSLRYGENPHQKANFYGDLSKLFTKLGGKDLSYNNLADIDAALQLMSEFGQVTFAIIKHCNVCGIAQRDTLKDAWEAALAGDPESAFGGILITNTVVTAAVAELMHPLFFEVLIAPGFKPDALELLRSRKNRILLQQESAFFPAKEYKRIFGGVLVQQADNVNFTEWREVGARDTTEQERMDMEFANIVAKHLRSNAISIVKNRQLIGKGCGQTSRIDALKHAIAKAQHNGFDLQGAVMASDAFFPFSDCVQMAGEVGISAVIQPGGSVRDADSISYCTEHGMAMVMTGTRHFKH